MPVSTWSPDILTLMPVPSPGLVAFDLLHGKGNTDPFTSSLGHRLSCVLMSYWKNPTRGNLPYVTGERAMALDSTATLQIRSLEQESIWLATSQPGRAERTSTEEGEVCLSLQVSLPLST